MRTTRKTLEKQLATVMPAFTRALVTHAIYHAKFGALEPEFIAGVLRRMEAAGTAHSASDAFEQAAQIAGEMVAAGKEPVRDAK